MSVLLNTCAGDIVIDLFVDDCPLACKNFLKLCKLKYYNGCLFYNIQPNLLAQTGDPTGTGKGGLSFNGLQRGGDQGACFEDEIIIGKKLNKVGMVCMSHYGGKENSNRSQFFITLRGEDMEHLEKTHTIFGEVAEGLEVLHILNTLYCDDESRPYQDVRIRHTYILDDPFPDPSGLNVPESPKALKPVNERIKDRIPYKPAGVEVLDERSQEEIEASIREKEAKSRAIILEMTGDLPDADVKPPEEVLFVCKLNPVTTDEDLELIFSRFGTIKSCEVIRDFKTGDSLSFAFIEFETEAACVQAYEKMNNVLIDDRRIKVDFSQSVSKLWNRFLAEPRKAPPSGSKRFNFPVRSPGSKGPSIDSPTAKHSVKHSPRDDKKHDEKRRDRSRSPPRDRKHDHRKDRQDSRDRRDDRSNKHRRDSRSRSRDRKYSDRRDDKRDDRDRRDDHRRDHRDNHKDSHRDRDRDDRHHKSSHRDRGDSRDRR